MKKYNKKNPPLWGTLTIEQYKNQVDESSFPVCESCENPILNPEFYSLTGMCGPCTTGESATIMAHPEEEPDCQVFAGLKI